MTLWPPGGAYGTEFPPYVGLNDRHPEDSILEVAALRPVWHQPKLTSVGVTPAQFERMVLHLNARVWTGWCSLYITLFTSAGPVDVYPEPVHD